MNRTTRSSSLRLACPLALAVVLATALPALAAPPDPLRRTVASAEQNLLTNMVFVQTFADHRWRERGNQAFDRGRFDEAARHYERAAGYADKLSQAMLAELHWHGRGVPQDRARAYAWMDLAAERGWPYLLGYRERYWQQLDADERTRALQVGEALYAQFGDDVAKPRMERELQRGRRAATGSRVGADVVTRVFDGDGGMTRSGVASGTVAGSSSAAPTNELTGFYSRELWEPARYWSTIDRAYGSPPSGRVVVREIVHERTHQVPLPRRTRDD